MTITNYYEKKNNNDDNNIITSKLNVIRGPAVKRITAFITVKCLHFRSIIGSIHVNNTNVIINPVIEPICFNYRVIRYNLTIHR